MTKNVLHVLLLAICAVSTPALAASVVEFYNTSLDHYFITADAGEAAAIDGGSAGPGWSRTGYYFLSGGSTAACRFYGSQSPGPNSHFYTVDESECQALKDQQIPAGDPSKLTVKGWNFESLDFVSTPPVTGGVNGTCPAGTQPVYRAYNNGFARNIDSNHRITSSLAAINEVVARGWVDEGVVMCAPPSGNEAAGTATFTKGAAALLESNAVFPGIVHDGTRLVISYAKNNHLYVRPYDTDFQPLADEIPVTLSTDAEVGAGVTDHKHIFFQNEHYLLFSTIGDADLYLVKLDSSLNRSGSIVTVTSNSTSTATNDMLLGTDGTNILTGEFRPPNAAENYMGSGHLIKKFDTNLTYLSEMVVINPRHTNTAALVNVGEYLYLVAPSSPVIGGAFHTQRNLLLMIFDHAWNATSQTATTLVDSNTLTHVAEGDGIWMSTGLVYDSVSNLLMVGHTFVNGAGGSDSGSIWFRVFDATNYTAVFSEKMVDSTAANRAHFLLSGDTLYVLYDEKISGIPYVFGMKYSISR